MTIGQQIKWDFKTNGDLKIKDKNSKIIYFEDSSGYWLKVEYDSKSNEIYREHSDGDWEKKEYDSQGNQIRLEYSGGLWTKWEQYTKGNQIFYENSNGRITYNRPKPCEDKVVEIEGVKYKLVKV